MVVFVVVPTYTKTAEGESIPRVVFKSRVRYVRIIPVVHREILLHIGNISRIGYPFPSCMAHYHIPTFQFAAKSYLAFVRQIPPCHAVLIHEGAVDEVIPHCLIILYGG